MNLCRCRVSSGDLCQGAGAGKKDQGGLSNCMIVSSEPNSFRRDRPSAHPHFRWRKGMTLAQGRLPAICSFVVGRVSCRYEVHGRLGDGTFGRVLAAKDLQTGESVAVKVGKGGDEFCEQAAEEVEILQHIQHSHPARESFCVKFLDSFLEPPKHFCLVFERLGISLRDFLKRSSGCGLFVEDLRRIAQQLLQGLAGLHTAGILHTDLKCRNVMLNDERHCAAPHPRDPGKEVLRPQDCSIRIVDFGSAIQQDETFRGRACTRQFRSPEVALGLPWDEKLDIWSAGCIIAMLYTGVRPFSVHENQEHLAMMERLLDDRFPQHMLRTARRNRTDQDEVQVTATQCMSWGQLFLAMPMPATSNQSTETPISSLDASNRTEEEEPVCEVRLDDEELVGLALPENFQEAEDAINDPVEAVDILRSEFDKLVDKMHGQFESLRHVVQAVPHAELKHPRSPMAVGRSPPVAVAKEPEILVNHRIQQSSKEQEDNMRINSRRYGASVGGREGANDIRLHGRWMELSTQFSSAQTAGTGSAVESARSARSTFALTKIKRSGTAELLDARLAWLQMCDPSGKFKLAWDGISILMVLLDAFTMPVSLAWGLDPGMGHDPEDSFFLLVTFAISFTFWALDIIVNFNTAIYQNGSLTKVRSVVVLAYVKGWFVFDLALIVLDVLTAATLGSANNGTANTTFRTVRLARALRLLRLVKMSKFNQVLQDLAASTGRQWMILVMAITNMSTLILVVAHILTCVTFCNPVRRDSTERELLSTGACQERYEDSLRQSAIPLLSRSWIAEADALNVPGWVQYLHSFRFILNNPSPAPLASGSDVERLVDIFMYIFCLVIIGTSISTISSTLAELRAMNEELLRLAPAEHSDQPAVIECGGRTPMFDPCMPEVLKEHARQRREIRIYLTNQNAQFDLVSRIMKFVDYKLEKMSPTNFDSSLISTTLQTELYVGQRSLAGHTVAQGEVCDVYVYTYRLQKAGGPDCPSAFLSPLPIFLLTEEAYHDVFAAACAVLKKDIYETGEAVFRAYKFFDFNGKEKTMEGVHWFEELSLYAEVLLHRTTLTALTFAGHMLSHGRGGTRQASEVLCMSVFII
eukprot:s6919_g1.t5